jgi:hypothetical protein
MNPALLTSIIVAVIAVVGSVAVALLRKPVSVQDLWAENRSLRKDMGDQDTRITELETKYEARDKERQRTIGILATALDILFHHLELLQEKWGNGDMPELTSEEQAVLQTARAIRPPIIGVP